MTKIKLENDRIHVQTGYNSTLVRSFGLIPGKKWDPDTKEWSFPICCRREVVAAMTESNLLAPSEISQIMNAYVIDMNPAKYTKEKLYDYQEIGVRYLLNNRKTILADDMGLGKTPQALIACAYLLEQKKIDAVVIFAPKSLKTQWKQQIFKFLGCTDVCIIEGNQKQRMALYCEEFKFYILNYETALKDLKRFELLPENVCIILDEAQRIKNWKSKTTQSIKGLVAKYKFVLTGTPLENTPLELYSINEFLGNGIFEGIGKFNNMFVVRDNYGAIINYKNLKYLNELLNHVMLRRRKQDVSLQLPELIISDYNIALTKDEISDYNQIAAPIYAALAKIDTQIIPQTLFGQLTLLRCYCNHPDTVRLSTSTAAKGLNLKAKTSSKFEEFKEIVHDLFSGGTSQLVVYTSFVQMQNILVDWLKRTGYPCSILRGGMTINEIEEEIQKFKTGKTKVFVSTDAGKAGLNLETANVILNYDSPWNPAILNQRIGRLHRIGQKNNVIAINMYVDELNSIEEKIKGTVKYKEKLFAQIIDGEEVIT